MQLLEETYNKLKDIYHEFDKNEFLLLWNYINDFESFNSKSAINKLENAIEISRISINEINLSSTTITAVFLYVFTQNKLFEKEKLEEIFGKEIAGIVSGLTKIPVIQLDKLSIQTEKFINLLLTISTDVRSILIKLAEMLYYLRNLKNTDRKEQIKTASEISVLYAPIAHRLGLYAIKTEMEDLSMKYLHPDIYKDIAKKLEATKASRNQYIEQFIAPLKKELLKQGINCEIKGRPKSIYSIWNKMKKQGVEFDEVYDKFAIRVIIDAELSQEKAKCWQVYSIITDKYVPNPRRLRDWISAPKASGYESLHTTVIGPEEKWVEVQIRTLRMDEIAEKGQAAHWKYKENKAGQAKSDWLGKIREILEKPDKSFHQSSNEEDKAKLYTDEIFVFTPKGDLKRLHKGYTVLDFAFSIHTNIGEKCTGAIVNGKIENIRHILKNGDEVKILTSKNQKPKYEWLDIVKSPRARAKIKRVIKAETYKGLDSGKEAVKQKLSQLKLDFNDIHINKLVVYFGFKTTLDFYQAVGEGKLDIHKIKKAFADIFEKENETQIEEPAELRILNKKITKSGTQDYLIIENQLQTIDYHLAKCCNPIPGDEIFGFVTVSKGTKIHKKSCPNAKDMYSRFPYRIVEAKWNTEHETGEFNVQIHINGKDKVGIVSTITEIIAKEFKLNLRALTIHPRKDNLFEGIIITSVNNSKQLNNLIERLKKIEDVYEVKRKVN